MCAVLAILFVATIVIFFGALFSLVPVDAPQWRNLFVGIGALVGLPIIVLAIVEIAAAIGLLYGNRIAKGFVIAFGVLHLVNIPIGTALGVYTLWALLRSDPIPSEP